MFTVCNCGLGHYLTLLGPPCHITNLPFETLTQIVENLFDKDEILYEISRESAADLASTARVSRLFYHLAMPPLWREVELWPSVIKPYSLLKYPGTPSEHVLNYIQRMCLCTDPGYEDMDKTKCNRLWKYISRCFRVLVAARSIRHLRLHVRLYNPDECAPELSNKIKAINSLVSRILRHVEQMRLDTLKFHPGRGTADINDIMRIIERKTNILDVHTVPLEQWVDRLQHHQNLNRIKVRHSDPLYENGIGSQPWSLVSAKFWVTISQLKKVTDVDVEGIPISPTLNIQYPHLISLHLRIWLPFAGRELSDSFVSIFTQMPNLETLHFHSWACEFGQQINNIEIHKIKCKNLRVIDISPRLPGNLVATIAKCNPNLTICSFEGTNVDDVDIRYLSECQHLRVLNLRSLTNVTNGLAYLTNLKQLDTLRLHYSMGKHMNTQLLLDIASSCLNLQKMEVSDFLAVKRAFIPSPFEDQTLAKIFAVGVELHPYIEPHYKEGEFIILEELDKYVIRLDKIRKDRDKLLSLSSE